MIYYIIIFFSVMTIIYSAINVSRKRKGKLVKFWGITVIIFLGGAFVFGCIFPYERIFSIKHDLGINFWLGFLMIIGACIWMIIVDKLFGNDCGC